MEALGRHVILEYYGIASDKLNDADFIEQTFVDAVNEMRATVISVHFHHFNPHGVSGAVVISESHLTIHTWPEYGYAAVDVFTCGNVVDPWVAHNTFKKAFEPTRDSVMEMRRGCFDVAPGTLPSCYGVKPEPSDSKDSATESAAAE